MSDFIPKDNPIFSYPKESTIASWSPRGIGMDSGFPCLVTGQEVDGYMANISGYVPSFEEGYRVVSVFGGRARLCFRDFEPHYLQVKIGVIPEHKPVLERLMKGVQDGMLTTKIVKWAIDPIGHKGLEPTVARYSRVLMDLKALDPEVFERITAKIYG